MKRIRTEPPRHRLLLCLCWGFGALLGSPTLHAQPAPDRAQARSHFDRGVALTKQHAYSDALAEFELAYAASPHFTVLYNIGQALTLLDRPSEALRAWQRYLDEGGEQIDPVRRAEVQDSIAHEQQKTGTVAISVDVEGAAITLDEQAIGRSPLPAPLRVDVGAHHIKVELEPGAARDITVDVAAGQAQTVQISLAAARPAAPVLLSPPPPVASHAPPSPSAPPPSFVAAPSNDHPARRTLGYAIGAAGVVLTAAAVSHYLWNHSRYEDWQSRSSAYYADPTDQHRDSANSLSRSVSAASAVTVGLIVGAGVALGTGAVLVVSSGPSASPARGAFVSLSGAL